MSLESFATQTIPKLRSPIQLAGLLFTVLAYALINKVDPNNVHSIAIVGSIGVALVAIPLAFDSKFIRQIAIGQRAWFLIAMLGMQLLSFGALAYITIDILYLTPPPEGSRFDSRLEEAVFFKKSDGSSRAELTWQLLPLSQRTTEGATVFVGLATLHDELKIPRAGLGQTTTLTCAQVPSCLGSHLFREMSTTQVYVKGGSPGSGLTAVIDFQGDPTVIRVWWEFYQREGYKDSKCGVSQDSVSPAEGIPPLALFDRNGRKVGNECYRSFGQKTLRVVYKN